MPNFICTTCGTQYAESDQPPAPCAIGQDERQYVKVTGQQWTTLDRLRLTNRNSIKFKEPGLIGIGIAPHFAIGQGIPPCAGCRSASEMGQVQRHPDSASSPWEAGSQSRDTMPQRKTSRSIGRQSTDGHAAGPRHAATTDRKSASAPAPPRPGPSRQTKERDQNMAKKEKPSTPSETDSTGSGGPTSQPSVSLTSEPQELLLTEGQRNTILKYADLPAHLSERLVGKNQQFTLDELDELLDHVEQSAYRAKGNDKQKVLRIVEKVAKLLGSTIDPAEMPKHRLAKMTDTVFQIKMTLRGIDPPIWRRIQTEDCTLEELHALIQVTMGWEFEHLYRFNIGGQDYADLEMVRDDEAEDAHVTKLSEVLPARNRRPRFYYEYDFGDEWIHQLVVEERFRPEEGVQYPICVAGQRTCPPEDCGGPWSYPDFVEAIRNPDHRRHEERLEWVGGDFDPARFDLEAVNSELRSMWTRKP
jgi:Plasmid pRiA4b ORF-3-like protein